MPLVRSNDSIELCDIQVGLTEAPVTNTNDTSTNGGGSTDDSSTLSGGAIAGIVVGAVAGVAALAAAVAYVARRRRLKAAAAGKQAIGKGAADNGFDAVAVQTPPGDGMRPSDLAWGAGGEAAAAANVPAAAPVGAAGMPAAGAAAAGVVALPLLQASRSGGSSGGPVSARASGGSSSTPLEATDLSKLPPGFNDGALVWSPHGWGGVNRTQPLVVGGALSQPLNPHSTRLAPVCLACSGFDGLHPHTRAWQRELWTSVPRKGAL